jgi:predicted ABC-type ATPase
VGQVKGPTVGASPRPKRIIIIAGPNGAGKTTFATEFLPREAGCPGFINADVIAAGLSPGDPLGAALEAGRVMLEEIRRRVEAGESFAFETTLAGRSYARQIPLWRARGYHVKLFFLSLPTEDMAVSRVAARVALGGHDVPEEVIRRRYHAGLRNFDKIYKHLVSGWILYDNAGRSPVWVDCGGSL